MKEIQLTIFLLLTITGCTSNEVRYQSLNINSQNHSTGANNASAGIALLTLIPRGIESFKNSDMYKYGFDGFDIHGYHKDTDTKYNPKGYDKDGFDKYGFNENGYDKEGYNNLGYDKDGFNHNGLDKDGYNTKGEQIQVPLSDGFDIDPNLG